MSPDYVSYVDNGFNAILTIQHYIAFSVFNKPIIEYIVSIQIKPFVHSEAYIYII